MVKMREVTRDLETQLGPDTGELSMRFGLNTGPVTAGLLRGDRSRFQLFGDTVNTAARMESTGLAGKIQCSQSTAEALRRSGKEHWLAGREDLVSAKGKKLFDFSVPCKFASLCPLIPVSFHHPHHHHRQGHFEDVLVDSVRRSRVQREWKPQRR